jgi:hypothetical protein
MRRLVKSVEQDAAVKVPDGGAGFAALEGIVGTGGDSYG